MLEEVQGRPAVQGRHPLPQGLDSIRESSRLVSTYHTTAAGTTFSTHVPIISGKQNGVQVWCGRLATPAFACARL